MKIEISQATYEFIMEQLKLDDQDCSWELAKFPPSYSDRFNLKVDDMNLCAYWKDKQKAVKNALKELRRGI